MKWRIALLIFLAIVVGGFRIFQGYVVLLGQEKTPPVNVDIKDGGLVVRYVIPKHLSGTPTSMFRAGLKAGDIIHGVYNQKGQGRELKNQEDLNFVIRTFSPYEPRVLVISRNVNGKMQGMRLTIPPESPENDSIKNRIFAFILNCGVPLMAIMTAFFIGFMKAEDNNAFVACLLFLGFSSLFGYNSPLLPLRIANVVEVTHLALNNGLMFLFMLFFSRFPSPSLLDRKAPWLKYVFLIAMLIALVMDLALYYAQYSSYTLYSAIKAQLSPYQQVFNLINLAAVVAGLLSLGLNTVKAESVGERRRMVILLTGTAIGVLPLVLFVIYMQYFRLATPPVWMLVTVISTMAIFPLSFIYVVLKHRVLGIRLIIRRGLQYILVSRGYVLIEGSIVFLLLYFISKIIFENAYPNASSLSVAIYSVLLTVISISALERLNRPIMQAIDRRFFREAYKSQQVLTNLSKAVRHLAAQPEKLLQTVTTEIADSLHPDRVAVFMRAEITPSLFSVPENGPNSGNLPAVRTAETMIWQHLETMSADEVEALDVYVDDPKETKPNRNLILPLLTGNKLLGYLSLGEKLSEEPYSKEDKELLLAVAQQTAIALDYAQLIQQVTEQEKLKREIEIAKQVQAQLFPQTLPRMQTLDYTGMCRAARGVGGDYYDFLLLTPEKLGIALGDISGKGISAALLMASLQALLRSHAPSRMDQVSALAGDINRLMQSSAAPGKYATFFYALYDEEQRTLTYVNAGHIPPVIFHATGTLTRLGTGGMVIGMFADTTYCQETVSLQPGDIFLSFSDGVTEAMNEQEEEYGEEALCKLISENRDLSADRLRELIVEKTDEFVGGAPQHDDFTLVIAKVL